MIGKIFLGKFWHWALLVAAAGLLWYCGSRRLHVIEFNWFVILMMLGTASAILAIVWFHRDGERVTRDELVVHELDADESARLARD